MFGRTNVTVVNSGNPTTTFTIESAKGDSVSIYDAAHNIVGNVVFDSDETSHSCTLSIIDGNEYVFESSIAKDPIIGGAVSYSKSVILTTSTTVVQLVPDDVSYWYGWGVDIEHKDVLSESEFIDALKYGGIQNMRVGMLVTLNNSYCDTYEIIGFDHDGNTGTVDVMAHQQVGSLQSDTTAFVEGGNIQTWLNGTFYNAFSDRVKALSKTILIYDTNKSGTQRGARLHVIILNPVELGYPSSAGAHIAEQRGTRYPAFAEKQYWYESGHSIDTFRAGESDYIWIRPKTSDTSGDYVNYTWAIYRYDTSDGLAWVSNSNSYPVLPVLRF